MLPEPLSAIPSNQTLIICPGRGLCLPIVMKGEFPMKIFKNVYCSNPYVAMTAERYVNESTAF